MVTLVYSLPSYPGNGNWTIRVEAMLQSYEYTFIVERYYIPFFEVLSSAPAYVLDSEESYTAAVTTSFHKSRVLKGNTTVQVHARPVNSTINDYRLVTQEHLAWVKHYKINKVLIDLK